MPLFRFAAAADIGGGERRRAIIRLRQLSFGSQVKLVFLLALFTALAIFALLLGFQLAGKPIGDPDSIPMLAVVALMFALMIAAIQIGALGLVRLLPWDGPSLKVEGGDHLRRVFE